MNAIHSGQCFYGMISFVWVWHDLIPKNITFQLKTLSYKIDVTTVEEAQTFLLIRVDKHDLYPIIKDICQNKTHHPIKDGEYV